MSDKITAASLSAFSAVVSRSPRLDRALVAADQPNYVRLRWRAADMAATDVANWVEFAEDPEAGRLASGYKLAGVLSADKKAFDGANWGTDGRHAVAYALGGAVMYGVLPPGREFGIVDDLDADRQEQRYTVAMRIGKGPLIASMGLCVPEEQRLVFPDPDVRPGARLANGLVPAQISIV